MKIIDNAIFFPAISIATHTTIMKQDWKVNNKSPRFYLNNKTADEQLFYHPYILTSAGHNYKNIDFMKDIGIADKTKDTNFIFGDSGGFQIGTGELKNTPEMINKLYDWMEHNATISPIIDIPPWTSETNVKDSAVYDSVKKTKQNIELLLKRPKNTTMEWLNVVHGNDYNTRVHWYNQVKDYDFYNGWALGSLRKNAFVILSAFATLLDQGELENDRCSLIHFFALTSTQYMPYAIYIKHKINQRGYKTNISFDSSYATQNGGWGKYLLFPSSTGFMSYHLSNKYVGKFKDVQMPCPCPVCKGVKLSEVLNEKALTNEGESYFYNVVQSHNVYMLVEYVNMLHSLIFTDCKELMNTCFKSHQMKVFSVIDKMFDAPKGKAYKIMEDNAPLFKSIHTKEQESEDVSDMFGDEE